MKPKINVCWEPASWREILPWNAARIIGSLRFRMNYVRAIGEFWRKQAAEIPGGVEFNVIKPDVTSKERYNYAEGWDDHIRAIAPRLSAAELARDEFRKENEQLKACLMDAREAKNRYKKSAMELASENLAETEALHAQLNATRKQLESVIVWPSATAPTATPRTDAQEKLMEGQTYTAIAAYAYTFCREMERELFSVKAHCGNVILNAQNEINSVRQDNQRLIRERDSARAAVHEGK